MSNINNEYKYPLSYAQFLKERNEFRRSGTRGGSEFNRFETPLNTYFKILFYFHNGDFESDNELYSGGLLAPTWENIKDTNYYEYNSAWSYLKMNGEEERAEKLQQFINLLSNISSEAPWTFNTISGLDTALERIAGQNKEFKIDEERKKISIKCIPDTYDTRVGTLLDLYKDIVWSWKTKREVVPSNLRKFDMGIYIYSDVIHNIHQPTGNATTLNEGANSIPTSYKYIEFHNCEIDYNSGKSGYGELNNSDGNQWEYTIDIFYDDAYENRYNEFLMRRIGDLIDYDTNMAIDSKIQPDIPSRATELEKRINMYIDDTITGQMLKELKGAAGSIISNKIHNAVLGNLFTASLPTISTQLRGVTKGHVFETINAVKDYTNGNYRSTNKGILGNLFAESSTKSKMKNV